MNDIERFYDLVASCLVDGVDNGLITQEEFDMLMPQLKFLLEYFTKKKLNFNIATGEIQ